ncbi:MAG: hypothetical protein JNN30_04225 [Rhodanobacteraceae bacterium]|nr:hypothetical protein [Rhodanobacteraceae bacterium]
MVINVGVGRDSSIARIDIVRGGGIQLLDDAAIRIARLAGPYPLLPKTAISRTSSTPSAPCDSCPAAG